MFDNGCFLRRQKRFRTDKAKRICDDINNEPSISSANTDAISDQEGTGQSEPPNQNIKVSGTPMAEVFSFLIKYTMQFQSIQDNNSILTQNGGMSKANIPYQSNQNLNGMRPSESMYNNNERGNHYPQSASCSRVHFINVGNSSCEPLGAGFESGIPYYNCQWPNNSQFYSSYYMRNQEPFCQPYMQNNPFNNPVTSPNNNVNMMFGSFPSQNNVFFNGQSEPLTPKSQTASNQNSQLVYNNGYNHQNKEQTLQPTSPNL
ncbi:hypothetical protein RF11_13081 [Thelohanellus kitauei]|uniref:Uncharacterized protein n=1 Tax=Thelohanellus kitauei TaxID=669202 RepID=A0A0C2IGY6_THEKT|nr:hypothetical protein RF11_13081 [Thelohanellus kitauei]